MQWTEPRVSFLWIERWHGAGSATDRHYVISPEPFRMIDRNDMLTLRTKMCELAEQVARGFGVTLDYSERSVRDVERILGEIHTEYRRTKSEEGLQGLALEFGAYLVSVLEKHRGPVVWKRDHPDFGEDAFPLEWRGATYSLSAGA